MFFPLAGSPAHDVSVLIKILMSVRLDAVDFVTGAIGSDRRSPLVRLRCGSGDAGVARRAVVERSAEILGGRRNRIAGRVG